jgi:hypothetical protein
MPKYFFSLKGGCSHLGTDPDYYAKEGRRDFNEWISSSHSFIWDD